MITIANRYRISLLEEQLDQDDLNIAVVGFEDNYFSHYHSHT